MENKKPLYNRCKICGLFVINSYCAKHDPAQRKLDAIIREDEALKRVLDRAREFKLDDDEKEEIRRLIVHNS